LHPQSLIKSYQRSVLKPTHRSQNSTAESAAERYYTQVTVICVFQQHFRRGVATPLAPTPAAACGRNTSTTVPFRVLSSDGGGTPHPLNFRQRPALKVEGIYPLLTFRAVRRNSPGRVGSAKVGGAAITATGTRPVSFQRWVRLISGCAGRETTPRNKQLLCPSFLSRCYQFRSDADPAVPGLTTYRHVRSDVDRNTLIRVHQHGARRTRETGLYERHGCSTNSARSGLADCICGH
jgi:hypothetical protein